jgi:hypothetical protein
VEPSADSLILSETTLRRFRFGDRTVARAGVALVVRTPDGRVQVVPGQRTVGEALFAPHSTQYEIDMADHITKVEVPVRTREDGYAFEVTIEITWAVDDAGEVARRGLHHGAALITTLVRDRLREMGRGFGIAQALEFEQEIRSRFRSSELVEGCLMVKRVSPEVTLDQAGTEQLAKLRAAKSKTEVIRAEHEGNVMERNHAEEIAEIAKRQELHRQRMERDHALAAKQAEEQFAEDQMIRNAQRQELAARREADWRAQAERQEAEWKADFERQQRELEMKMRWAEETQRHEFDQMRSQQFLEAIKQGESALLALHLGSKPEDAGRIVDLIVKNHELGEERRSKLLADLYNNGAINEADLDGTRERLADAFFGSLTRPFNGVFNLNTTVEVDSVLGRETAAIDTEDADASPAGGAKDAGSGND